MVGARSLAGCSSPDRILSDPDPLVRVSAVHHARTRLAADPGLRTRVRELLGGADELVARYAAVTLAWAGDPTGLDFLLAALRAADPAGRADLRSCVRDCTRFPIAVLLNEVLDLECAGTHELLPALMRATAQEAAVLAAEDPRLADRLVAVWEGGAKADRAELGQAVVVTAPAGESPGFVVCPRRGCFLQFHAATALNPEAARPGSECLVGWAADDPTARVVYVLEHTSAAGAADRLRTAIEAGLCAADSGAGGLRAGVVTGQVGGDGGPRSRVLFATGAEITLAAAYAPGRLVVAEPGGAGPARCHIPRIPVVPGPAALAVVRAYAKCRGLLLGVRTDAGWVVPAHGRWPAGTDTVLLAPCVPCTGSGRTRCESCVSGMTCSGSIACPRCKGVKPVEPVPRTTAVVEVVCPGCNADLKVPTSMAGKKAKCKKCGTTFVIPDDTGEPGEPPCHECRGTGRIEGCGGSGRRPCTACDGKGTERCRACGGRGSTRRCPKCEGNGTRANLGVCHACEGAGATRGRGRCSLCEGSGYLVDKCSRCRGKGVIPSGHPVVTSAVDPCVYCRGGTRDCERCAGTGELNCPLCDELGRRTCSVCRGEGTKACPACDASGLTFHTSVELPG